jgi:hypothetical protein
MARIVRLTESDLTRLVKRVIKEQSNKTSRNRMLNESNMVNTLIKSFPDVDENELMGKWEEFKEALAKCIGEDEMKKMTGAAAMSIIFCIMTIFGAVYSFGILSAVGGTGCTTGVLIAGKSVSDVVSCVKKQLSIKK